ncbi:hypothetical protein TTHERM_01478590 (macronuclear) [Tetrahymena thermophila SB210]|uniref:Uncharacterized protein n=1 Tax=Tetrahymena thermophila (strain SB210) TaxID=312017 RepID=Q228W2_TETTS|nr:hypothetical protein TTHERM_01478590 [Tetrahymena thermophila SB210]EAR81833.2 hypothetical protein TTHERM_01478590 [Tetrahymena thermophila SB210]|eukprot:XP_001029496.2 hypothetical protein TTHERM_01478590 [Tetrahymena thermophila SB210]
MTQEKEFSSRDLLEINPNELIEIKKLSIKFESNLYQNELFVSQNEGYLSSLHNLSDLTLIFESNCNLGLEGWNSILKSVQQLTQLEKLVIQVQELCFLEDQGFNLLNFTISSLKKLKKLEIEIQKSNYISHSSLQNFVQFLNNTKYLIELKLKIDELQPKNSETNIEIWQGLQQLEQIESLDLDLDLRYQDQNEIDQLFQSILTFKKITKLNLALRILTSCSISRITHFLQQMISLTALKLNFKDISLNLDDILHISTFFNKLTNLEEIHLENLQNQNKDLGFFNDEYFQSLSQLAKLKSLKLDFDKVGSRNSSQSEAVVCKSLENKSQLNILELITTNHQLYEETITKIAQQIYFNCDKLKQLNFQIKTKISLIGYQNLSESFKQLNQLSELKLNLYFEDDTTEGQNKLLNSLSHLSNLKDLNLKLNYNFYTNVYRQQSHLAFSFLKQIKLVRFQLAIDCMIANEEFIQLGEGLQNQDILEDLVLSISFLRPQFGQVIQLDQIQSVEAFVDGIKSLQNLKKLDFYIQFNQSFSQDQINQIIQSLQHLQNLEEINNLALNTDFETFEELSQTIKKLCNLKKLIIRRFQIVDQDYSISFIKSIQNLKDLQHLDLGLSVYPQSWEKRLDIENALLNLTQLKTLNLQVLIQEADSYFKDIFRGLKHLKNLNQLEINFDQIYLTDSDALEFREACSGLLSLQQINIINLLFHDTDFTKEGAIYFQQGLQKLKNLKSFVGNFIISIIDVAKAFDSLLNQINLNKLDFKVHSEYVRPQIDSEIKQTEQIQLEEEEEVLKQEENHIQKYRGITQLTARFQNNFESQVDDISQFYSKLVNLYNLNYLILSHSWFYDQQVDFANILRNITNSFSHFQKLQTLEISLSNCSLNLEKTNIENLKYLVNLQILKLGFSKVSIYQDQLLFLPLQYLQNLQQLCLFFTAETPIQKLGAQALGNSLKFQAQLNLLQLEFGENSKIEQEGAVELGLGLKGLLKIQYLSLKFGNKCEIGNSGAQAIAQGLSQLSTLHFFDLQIGSSNNISPEGGSALASSIKSMQKLKDLVFIISNGNNQDQTLLDSISLSLNQLRYIQRVSFSSSFCEYFRYCPKQLKQLFSNEIFSETSLQIYNDLVEQSIIELKGRQNQQIQLSFQFEKIQNYSPHIEIESLEEIQIDNSVSLQFNFKNQQESDYYQKTKEQILKIKSKKLTIQFQQGIFNDHQLTQIVLPSLNNQNLQYYKLEISQLYQIEEEYFVQIAQLISKLKISHLIFQFQGSQSDQIYKKIMQNLSNSQHLYKIELKGNIINEKLVIQQQKYMKILVDYKQEFLYF